MSRASVVYSLKVLIGMYVAVSIALLAFFIKPTNLAPRFGLGTSAIFAAIASQYVIASVLPDTSQLTLVERLHVVADATILLSLIVSVVSLFLYEKGRQRASWLLDRVMGVLLIAAYVAVNVWFIQWIT